MMFSSASAENGSANVYILALTDVPCHNFKVPESHDAKNLCRDGAVLSLNFHEGASLPFVHPKYGTSHPFYDIRYQVVTDWATYTDVIEHQSNAIIVNCHGEILPVPSSYSAQSWIAIIADAMLNRSAVWVHTGGYPFYWVWLQGAIESTLWGASGFQDFTHYIGIENANCSPPADETTPITISGYASDMLSQGWPNMNCAYYAELGRPLDGGAFRNYTVYALWGSSGGSMPGAVVTFVKPSQRFTPDQHKGFGAYVHIGTRNVTDAYHNAPYNSNFMRGYVGCVAALAEVVQRFKPETAYSNFTESGGGYSEIGAIATPVIANWNRYHDTQNSSNDHWIVDVDYALYCVLKTNGTARIDQVEFETSSDYDCQIRLTPNESLSARRDDLYSVLKVFTATGFVAFDVFLLLAPEPEPGSKLYAIVQLLNGVQLFSEIYDLANSVRELFPGPDDPPGKMSRFVFPPDVYSESKAGFTFYEFESSVRVQVVVGYGNLQPWSILPLNFNTAIKWETEATDVHYLSLCSDSDVCYHYPDYNVVNATNTTIFFDDFQKGLDGWTVGDNNLASGLDYWGIYTGNGGNSEPCVYCAEVGNNSLFGETPNVNIGWFGMYDKNMDATLSLDLDLIPYRRAWIRFKACCSLGTGDHLAVEIYNSGWTTLRNYTTDALESPTLLLPRISTSLRFRFYSNSDGNVGQNSHPYGSGAWIYYVELLGEIPNDAINTSQDAGESQATALQISSSGIYEGYLDYDQDWYNFTVTASDISNKKLIMATMYAPANSIFTMKLYNPRGTLRAGPSALLTYVLSSADKPGKWSLQIPYATKGFGQYRFDLSLSSGGAGCPYVYAWNGSAYVKDNNILPASETGNGTDTKDYYKLEQPLVPVFSTQQASLYCLRIREFENEQDYIDQVKLMAVGHSRSMSIAVTQEGEIVTYQNPAVPFSCVDNNGNSRLSEISRMDGNVSDPATYFHGDKGDWLVLDFGRVTAANAKLILRVDMKSTDVCIDVQVPDADDGWQTVEVLRPRDFWAVEAVNMTAYIPADGDFTVRLLWTATHRLDYVGLDTSSPAQVQVSSVSPILAVHSTMEDVTAKLLYDDENCVKLVNGQQITLAFILPNKVEGTTRDFILYTDGYYCTITP